MKTIQNFKCLVVVGVLVLLVPLQASDFKKIKDKEDPNKKTITMLFIGGCQSGKTSTIDSIANVMKKIKITDTFRFQLSGEDKPISNMNEGNTKTTVMYNLTPTMEEFKQYNFKIIDTPGFIAENVKKATNNISSFLRDNAIEVDIVCIVERSTTTRLGMEEKTIYEEIKRLLKLSSPNIKGKLVGIITNGCNRKNTSSRSPGLKVLKNKFDIKEHAVINNDYLGPFDNNNTPYDRGMFKALKRNIKRLFKKISLNYKPLVINKKSSGKGINDQRDEDAQDDQNMNNNKNKKGTYTPLFIVMGLLLVTSIVYIFGFNKKTKQVKEKSKIESSYFIDFLR